MGNIKLLDEAVSNRIAAGEVIENPASVVKELAENAIDANATSITIELAGSGFSSIRVTDNGEGMDESDVLLAFERHATSKIQTVKDLLNIRTLGFRGEALSSIAAVSETEIKTKFKTSDTGTVARISGGKDLSIRSVGLPDGTTVIVKNLFFNTPVRRKFLKTPARETALVTDLVSRLILAHPEISFKYISNGNTVFHTPGDGDVKTAVFCVYGREILEHLVPVSSEDRDVSVSGYTGLPEFAYKNRIRQSFFVNQRYVRSRQLSEYVQSAYRDRLVKGLFPFCLLHIRIPAGLVDVNVHPNKLRIRFTDEPRMRSLVQKAVADALKRKGFVNELRMPPEDKTSSAPEKTEKQESQIDFFTGFSQLKAEKEHLKQQTAVSADESKPEMPETSEPAVEAAPGSWISDYTVVGTAFDTYLLLEQEEKLLIVDQHAAHERLLYDRIFRETKAGRLAAQRLLSPEIIRLSEADKLLLMENIELLTELGFDIQEFGLFEFKVSGVPYYYDAPDVNGLIDDLLGELKESIRDDIMLRKEKIARMACRKAIKAGAKLSRTEIDTLMRSFARGDSIPTCPHGRPIFCVLKKSQIEKNFRRIV